MVDSKVEKEGIERIEETTASCLAQRFGVWFSLSPGRPGRSIREVGRPWADLKMQPAIQTPAFQQPLGETSATAVFMLVVFFVLFSF